MQYIDENYDFVLHDLNDRHAYLYPILENGSGYNIVPPEERTESITFDKMIFTIQRYP